MWAQKLYKCNPIFLSVKPDAYKVDGSVLLKVDVAGLPLVADLPSLVGVGYMLEHDGMYLDDEMVSENNEEMGEGLLTYQTLLDPESGEAKFAIQTTESAACLQDIEPRRIAIG